MNPVDADSFERSLDRFVSGKSQKHPDLTAYAPIAADSIRARRADPSAVNGINERIAALKLKLVRCAEIAAGYDQPNFENPVTEAWISETHDACTSTKGEISMQVLAMEINKAFTFRNVAAAGEFLRYDEKSGRYLSDAAEFIGSLVRRILPTASTSHLVNEVIAYVKDTNLCSVSEMDHVPEGFINLQNGVFEISTGKLLPHDPAYNFRWVLPFRFNRRTRRDLFFNVLSAIVKDDLRKFIVIMELFAWPFVQGYPIQKAAAFHGTGNNGKSIVLGVLVAFLGNENLAAISLQTLLDNRFAVLELRGKLANIAGDVGSATLYDTDTFKRLTGGDLVSGEIKGLQRRVNFLNTAKMLYSFNRLPRTRDTTPAYYRRFELLEFVQDFEATADPGLLRKITREEDLQSIFNVVATIFLPALQKKLQFEFTANYRDTQQKYELNADPSVAYIHENLEADPEMQIESGELYSRFVTWCSGKNIRPVPDEAFGFALQNRSGMAIFKRRRQEGGIRKLYYVGIRYSGDLDGGQTSGTEQNQENNGSKLRGIGSEQSYATYAEAVNAYVQRHHGELNGTGGKGFYTLSNYSQEYIRVQKPLPAEPIDFENSPPNQENNGSKLRGIGLGKPMAANPSSDDKQSHAKKDETIDNSAETPLPDAIPDKNSITLDQCKDIIGQLLNLGYHVSPGDSGPSINGEMYKIAVTKPVNAENLDRLLRQLNASGFQLANTGAIGPLIFTAPLRRDGA